MLNFSKEEQPPYVLDEEFKEVTQAIDAIDGTACWENGKADYLHVSSRSYEMDCNYKVFCDNFLDGGYHVSLLHKDLASRLRLESYDIRVGNRYSLQRAVAQDDSERLGQDVCYAFLHPNLMLNRYGCWLDTNTVLPVSPDKCIVVFDYYISTKHPMLKELGGPGSAAYDNFMEQSLQSSHRVQEEDMDVCESTQRGLQSSGYIPGRYNPRCEDPSYQFHLSLFREFREALSKK